MKMADYIIREDAFMALTGDITDCTIEEFIARLRDKLSKLPSVSQGLVKDAIKDAIIADLYALRDSAKETRDRMVIAECIGIVKKRYQMEVDNGCNENNPA